MTGDGFFFGFFFGGELFSASAAETRTSSGLFLLPLGTRICFF
jgi:hypothetical protein